MQLENRKRIRNGWKGKGSVHAVRMKHPNLETSHKLSKGKSKPKSLLDWMFYGPILNISKQIVCIILNYNPNCRLF